MAANHQQILNNYETWNEWATFEEVATELVLPIGHQPERSGESLGVWQWRSSNSFRRSLVDVDFWTTSPWKPWINGSSCHWNTRSTDQLTCWTPNSSPQEPNSQPPALSFSGWANAMQAAIRAKGLYTTAPEVIEAVFSTFIPRAQSALGISDHEASREGAEVGRLDLTICRLQIGK